MDTVRYVFAIMVVVFLPPAIGLWYVIHPLARFWRRFGAVRTYMILAPLALLFGNGLYQGRAAILGADLGFSVATTSVGVVAVVAGALIARARRRLLTQRILLGVPELSPSDPGVLLTTGVYGRIRHPRYVEIVCVVFGYASFSNYVGAYVVCLLSLPALYVVVLLEERELRQRFGDAYLDYCRRVPRFVPRWGRT